MVKLNQVPQTPQVLARNMKLDNLKTVKLALLINSSGEDGKGFMTAGTHLEGDTFLIIDLHSISSNAGCLAQIALHCL